MTPLSACTIVSKNYLPFARVLADSFRRHHPEGRFFVLLVDRIDGHFDPSREPFELLEAGQLSNVPDLPGFLFKYTILESNTAIKPFLLQYLLERFDLPNLVYFDPDIQILSSLDRLAAVVAESSLVLTPHLNAPIEDDYHPGELAILQSGAYNLGFLALRHCDAALAHLDWWQRRLYDRCVVRIEEGLFVDQKWMDLAPSLVDEVTILRDPGYNAAYWNLHARDLDARENGVFVNGEHPLVFFHFSGIEPESLDRVSKHQDRFRIDQIGHAANLYRDYADLLFAAGFRACRQWPFAYGVFDNGVPIPDALRRLYLELSIERRRRFGDPFQTEGNESFWRWINSPPRPGGVSRFLRGLYDQRPDLHPLFPEPDGRDLVAFSGWMHEYGRHELRIAPEFLAGLPAPRGLRSLSLDGIKSRLRRAYRSSTSVRLKEGIKRRLGPARSARIKERLGRDREAPPESVALGTLGRPTQARKPRAIEHPGINLIGYLRAETGMGEAARSLARALAVADIPHTLHSLDLNVLAPNRDQRLDSALAEATSQLPYDLNLLVVNADQVPAVFTHLGPEVTAGRINVGLWLWELSLFPSLYHSSFAYLHEVWTPSTFCVEAFSSVAPIPVRRVPLPVDPPTAEHDRGHFGLPEGEFLFLYMFNFLSYFDRKNPLGLVEAFRRAFPTDAERRGVRLVLKTSQSDFAPNRRGELEAAIDGLPVTLLDGYYSAAEISSLVAVCDAYASLHRAEGYGLTLAEAMAHGRPVVATAYSGNTDFFNINNGFPVRYALTTLETAAGPYPAGAQWADPDLDHAARGLREVRDGSEATRRRTERARSDVRNHLSDQAVGERLRRAFDAVLARVP